MKIQNHNRIDFHGQHKNMKKHCETHDWLLASHMKMLFLLGPFPTRRDVCRTTFQSKPQRADNLTAKREKGIDRTQQTRISKLRRRWKQQQGAKERQTLRDNLMVHLLELVALHSTLFNLHSTLFPLHFTLRTVHFTLQTLHFTLHTLV